MIFIKNQPEAQKWPKMAKNGQKMGPDPYFSLLGGPGDHNFSACENFDPRFSQNWEKCLEKHKNDQNWPFSPPKAPRGPTNSPLGFPRAHPISMAAKPASKLKKPYNPRIIGISIKLILLIKPQYRLFAHLLFL